MSKVLISSKILRKDYFGNIRKRALISAIIAFLCLFFLLMGGALIGEDKINADFTNKNLAPSFSHLFGTDWLGRDMLARTLKGLGLSFWVGLLAAFSSVLISLVLSLVSALNKTADAIVTWLVDLFLGVPHLVSLILISFMLGGGAKGVVIGVALTHWPSLTRVLRAEVLQIRNAEYIGASRQMGKSPIWIGLHHVLPHLVSQLLVGFVLLFPHAILHEAAITFLGFGLSSEQPAIGVILSESMRYLSVGMWWLALFPGFSLILMVALFDVLGKYLRILIDPFKGQRI